MAIPQPEKCFRPRYDLWPVTLTTFTAMPTCMMRICDKFHWNPFIVYRDTADGQPDDRKTSCLSAYCWRWSHNKNVKVPSQRLVQNNNLALVATFVISSTLVVFFCKIQYLHSKCCRKGSQVWQPHYRAMFMRYNMWFRKCVRRRREIASRIWFPPNQQLIKHRKLQWWTLFARSSGVC